MHNNFSSLPPALMLLHLPLHFLYDFDLNLDATYCCTRKLNVDRKTLLKFGLAIKFGKKKLLRTFDKSVVFWKTRRTAKTLDFLLQEIGIDRNSQLQFLALINF